MVSSGRNMVRSTSRTSAETEAISKCQNSECQVKKKVEWSGEEACTTYLKVTYEGAPHNHRPPPHPLLQIADLMANEHNLLSQFLSLASGSGL
ncbi:hypothetical protein H6P81_004927 [Aristolochia fimbriata]|uniref:WRKY domain-containing protein n=1 Tax=Aristolochia fimbriata TaxID=158543 RepID=A0AAV7ETJ3_ARIFI|nr:hypothetical protein H6P81_004927 [Aristolochia fimbriata]